MIGLGLRLTFNGGREALVRLVVIAAAVALGVCMLLMALAAINAVGAQNARYAWLNAAYQPSTPHPSGTDPLWWQLQADHFEGKTIGVIDVAATGPQAPVPPGITALPGPGEFYVSPAMSALLKSTPPRELAERFPGRQIGVLAASALPSPDSLLIMTGRTPASMAHQPDADQVVSFAHAVPDGCGCYQIGINPNGIDFILAVVGAAVLFPVLIFIGVASRLSAARREQRFAAMRLVGATPRQISIISAVESAVAAIGGAAVGFGLFFALRPAFATFAFTGARFFTSDLSLRAWEVVLVAVGVPCAAALATRIALRRVQISPLGVSRRTTPPRPRVYRLIPLLAGIAELVVLVIVGRPAGTTQQIEAFFAGFLLMMIGLVVAGPWFTMLGSRLAARRANRASVLIAGRRLSDNPQAAFRAISGLMLALFVTSVAVGAITTWDTNRATPSGGASAHNTLVDQFFQYARPGTAVVTVSQPSAALLAQLRGIEGVRGVTTVQQDPHRLHAKPAVKRVENGKTLFSSGGPLPTGFASCAELAKTPGLGRCRPGAQVASVPAAVDDSDAGTVWPSARVTADQLPSLRVLSITVATDGSNAAIEQARTALRIAYPEQGAAETIGEQAASQLDIEYQQLADVVILLSLPIAGCSLATSVAGGLNDRRRPFSLLRLAGTPLRVLRHVVVLESVVPLLIGAVVAIGTGFLAAALFLEAQLDYELRMPGLEYYLIVGAGLVASLGIIASILPMLSRVTSPESVRNE